MSYSSYDVEDFASDPKFREWVLNPDPATNFFWEKWIINNPDKKKVIETARLLVSSHQFAEVDFSEEERQRLLTKIDRAIESKEGADRGNARVLPIHPDWEYLHDGKFKRKKDRRWWLNVAAILIGLLASSIFVIESTIDTATPAEDKVTYIEKDNPTGRRTLTLPDGSVVVLNAKSKISYPSGFAEDVREVKLSGEAFFEVVADSSRPFVVKTDEISTRVLGTSFNIKAHPSSANTSVCLVSGKVLVEKNEAGNQETVVLVPGEAAGFDKSTGKMLKRKFNYMEEITWKDGTLYFNETPLTEVFDKLELWYGVTFHYDEIPAKVKPISGGFTNEYLSNILQSVSYTVNFDYEIKGQEVQIKFK